MKKISTVLSKHVFTNNSVYRLTYHIIEKENQYGIMITSEKFKCRDLVTKKIPFTTQITSDYVILESLSFDEVLKIAGLLSDNIVFPSTLKDIIYDIMS